MISITLPSIYPDALWGALDNLAQTTKGPYEVVVVSPFDVREGASVQYVKEQGPSRGCAAAHARAALAAHGDFIVPFADDHRFVDGWDQIALAEFKDRERRNPSAPILSLGLRGAHSSHVGTNFGIYYPYFPMMRREAVGSIGWIGYEYAEGFGDSDLAMRVWAVGGRCEWSQAGLLYATAHDNRKRGENQRSDREAASFSQADLKLFTERWAPRFGKGWATNRIGDFNIDLRPEENPHLNQGNTYYDNDPSFMGKVNRICT